MGQLFIVKERIINFIKLNKTWLFKILILFIVMMGIFTIVGKVKTDDNGNTAGNLYTHGISAIDGKWIYYISFDDNEPAAIYKVKKKGEKKEKITEGYFEYLNVVDGHIYCIERNEEKAEYNLIKMTIKGKKKETLAKNIDEEPITVKGKKVYYLKDRKLYSIKTNGSDRDKLSDKEIEYYQISGNMIYYIYSNEGDSYLAKMKKSGKKNLRIGKLKKEEKAKYKMLQVKGNKIYYITELENENSDKTLALYAMNKKGEKIEKMHTLPDYSEIINMQEDAIYYVVEDDEYKIYRMNYKTGKREIIKKVDDLETIGISGKWLFYVTEADSDIIIKRIDFKGSKEQKL